MDSVNSDKTQKKQKPPPLREQNQIPSSSNRPLPNHSRPSGSSLTAHEKLLHNIFASVSKEPLVMSESHLKHAASCEKEFFNASKHAAKNHVVDDVEMFELDRAVTPTESIQDVMRDVIVFVQVRAETDRTDLIKTAIKDMGVKVNDRLYKNTTHVVFKDGLQSTYDRAKELSIPLVSVSWIEACKQQLRLVDPKNFGIADAYRYENPQLYPKSKRYRELNSFGENTGRHDSESSEVTRKAAAVTGGLIEMPPTHSSNPTRQIRSDDLCASFARMCNASPALPEFNASTVSARPPAVQGDTLKRIYEEYEENFNQTLQPNLTDIARVILHQRIKNISQIEEAKKNRNMREVDSDFVVPLPPPDSFEEFMKQYETPKNV